MRTGTEAAALEEATGARLSVELPVLDQHVAALHHDFGRPRTFRPS